MPSTPQGDQERTTNVSYIHNSQSNSNTIITVSCSFQPKAPLLDHVENHLRTQVTQLDPNPCTYFHYSESTCLPHVEPASCELKIRWCDRDSDTRSPAQPALGYMFPAKLATKPNPPSRYLPHLHHRLRSGQKQTLKVSWFYFTKKTKHVDNKVF